MMTSACTLQDGVDGLEEEKDVVPGSSEERCRGETGTVEEGPGSSGEAEVGVEVRRRKGGWQEVVQEVAVPIIVVVLGVGFSVAALWVSLSTALWPAPND